MKTNTKSVKASKKSGNKTKKTKTAPVEAKATIQVEVTPVAPVVAQIRGRGRPKDSLSQSLVSLQNLIDSLPANSKIVLPNPFIRNLSKLGINLTATPFKAGITQLAKVTEAIKPATSVVVTDLNQETVAA